MILIEDIVIYGYICKPLSLYNQSSTAEEANASRSQNVTLKRGENIKYLPYAFTEHGVLMLCNVLKSKSAIDAYAHH